MPRSALAMACSGFAPTLASRQRLRNSSRCASSAASARPVTAPNLARFQVAAAARGLRFGAVVLVEQGVHFGLGHRRHHPACDSRHIPVRTLQQKGRFTAHGFILSSGRDVGRIDR